MAIPPGIATLDAPRINPGRQIRGAIRDALCIHLTSLVPVRELGAISCVNGCASATAARNFSATVAIEAKFSFMKPWHSKPRIWLYFMQPTLYGNPSGFV